MNYRDWYCVQVASGCENKAKADLLARKAVLDDRYILGVEVPETTELMVQKNGKRKAVRTKVLPGYILVQVRKQEVEDESGDLVKEFPRNTQQTIRATFNVIGFAGADKNKPQAMRPSEVKSLFDRVDETHVEVKQNVQIDYNLGDRLDVVGGPFKGHTAEVLNVQGQKILAQIEIFDRPTSAWFSPEQLYKGN